MAGSPNAVASNSKEVVKLLSRLQDGLSRATDKNNALLESLETVEARAIDFSSSETSLLRTLRARLAATHLPNADLRKDLPLFNGLFQKRFEELSVTLKSYNDLTIKLQQEAKDLEDGLQELDKEREAFEEERAKWKRELDQARKEITEQNDRLTLLSQQLSGEKNELEMKTNELANRRIAFEEEKLVREKHDVEASLGEAETLRRKLRDQALTNVHLENNLLRSEVSVHQREQEIMALEEKNLRLQQEVQQLRLASSRAVKQFEKRTKEANMKLSEMNSEVSKAQEHAQKFQDLLTMERRKKKALEHTLGERQRVVSSKEGLTPAAQKAYLDTLSETLQTTKPRSNVRVEDVIRKSESVLVENATLKAEVHKLKMENTDLMKRVRFADTNAHYMRNQVLTNLHDRADLMKKLDKAEQKYQDLELSLSQQAKDWVTQMKKEKSDQRQLRIQEIKPVSVLGASERTWNTGPAKPQPLSRTGIQVTKW